MSDEEDTAYHCTACDRRLSDQGWALCQRCSDRFAADLLEVAERYHHLNASTGYEPGRYDKPTGGKPGSKAPGRVDVMALRDFRSGQSEPTTWRGGDGRAHREPENDTPSILRTLVYWADRIGAERGYAHHPDATVDATVEFLGRQGDWIARWTEAGELVGQVRRLRNRLRSATGEPNAKPSAWCVAQLEDGTECAAAVFIPTDTDKPSYVPVVRCSGAERHEYTRGDLARLALANEQAKREREAS